MKVVDGAARRRGAAGARALRHRAAQDALGKLLRRAIQAVCEGRDPGDLTTMDDPAALQQIKDLVTG